MRDARDRAEAAREAGEAAARRAEALRLAADAELALRTVRSPMIVALALAAESVLTMPTVQGDMALRHVLRLHPRTLARLDHDGGVGAVAFSPDGARVATGSDDRSRAGVRRGERSRDRPPGPRRLGGRGGVQPGRRPGGHRQRRSQSRGCSTRRAEPRWSAWTTTARWTRWRSARMAPGWPPAAAIAVRGCSTRRAGPSWPAWTTAAPWTRWRSARTVPGWLPAAPIGSARVFDAASGAEISRLDHGGPVGAVAFSPDGARVATGSGITVRGCSTRRPGPRCPAWTTTAPCTRWRSARTAPGWPPAATIAVARVFDAASGAEISRLDHGGSVNAVAFSPDGARVATGSAMLRQQAARVFDAASGAEISRLDHDGPVNAVAFSPDGARVATGSADRQRAGVRRGERRRDRPPGPRRLRGRGGVQPGRRPGGHRQRRSQRAGVRRGERGRDLRLDHDGSVGAVAFSPDGARVATGSGDRSRAGVRRGERSRDLPPGPRRPRERGGVQPRRRPGGHRQRRSVSARVFDAASGAEISRLDHDRPVYAVAFSPDGTRVATGSGDNSARVFDAASGAEISRLDHGGSWTRWRSARTAPGWPPAATIGSARVFDAATGAEIWPAWTTTAACSRWRSAPTAPGWPPAATMAARGCSTRRPGPRLPPGPRRPGERGGVQPRRRPGSYRQRGRSARVFDAASGAEISRLDHDGSVDPVAFSPDGARVATGSADRSALVFEVEVGALIQRALCVMTRTLNTAELRRYSLPPDCGHVKLWNERSAHPAL